MNEWPTISSWRDIHRFGCQSSRLQFSVPYLFFSTHERLCIIKGPSLTHQHCRHHPWRLYSIIEVILNRQPNGLQLTYGLGGCAKRIRVYLENHAASCWFILSLVERSIGMDGDDWYAIAFQQQVVPSVSTFFGRMKCLKFVIPHVSGAFQFAYK